MRSAFANYVADNNWTGCDTHANGEFNIVLFASGEGRAEDIGESWRVARILGDKGVPNRVDSWGEEWHHDWPTWRNMLVKYLDEMTAED